MPNLQNVLKKWDEIAPDLPLPICPLFLVEKSKGERVRNFRHGDRVYANYRFGMMAGYQESRYSFKASGGSFNYTDEDTGLPDFGTFPAGTTVIGYKQHFKMPYIGIVGSYRYERFEFGGSFKYSGWVRATDNDEHYLTDTTFRANIKNQNFYSLIGNAAYYLTADTKIYLEGAWNRVTNKKGSLSANDYGSGEKNSAENSSGIESYSFMTTVGLKYSF